mmetsp:Transcript_37484/g.27631  ORF Transcript_37484/g.27631 Transcript_37484/m.27631 type:complete len:127 (+) Transcript_37484:685-1065(+)
MRGRVGGEGGRRSLLDEKMRKVLAQMDQVTALHAIFPHAITFIHNRNESITENLAGDAEVQSLLLEILGHILSQDQGQQQMSNQLKEDIQSRDLQVEKVQTVILKILTKANFHSETSIQSILALKD